MWKNILYSLRTIYTQEKIIPCSTSRAVHFGPCLIEMGLRIDNSRYGPFRCGRSTLGTGMSLLRSYIHIIYHSEADFMAYLII